MADRTVTVRLKAAVDGYKRDMTSAAATTKKFGSDAAAHTKAVSTELATVSDKAQIVGASLLGLAALSVIAFASFDKQMSGVKAVTGATADELDRLRDAAINAGQATVFSASDAANAETELAKAGVSTADILSGALTGSLALAAAGQLAVADAASIAATTMTQFGLAGTDVGHIADLLTAGANKAQGSVADLGVAMKYVGPVAHQMGVSVDQTVGTLAELASNGILADQAGTSLRGMLTALTSPSKIAADEMGKLGINVYDTAGNFVGFDGVAGELSAKLGKLTNQQRDAALGMIFGNEQITAARILYAGGAKAVDEWTGKVNDSGIAARQAAIQMDNLAGDFNNLQSSLETTFIKSGSQANGVLRDMTQSATGLVNFIGDLPGPILAVGLATTAMSGGFLIAAPRIVAVNEVLSATPKLAAAASRAMALAVPAAAVIAAVAFALDMQNASQEVDALDGSMQTLYATLGKSVTASSVDELRKQVQQLQADLNDPGPIANFENGLQQLWNSRPANPLFLRTMDDASSSLTTLDRKSVILDRAAAKYSTFQEVVGNVAYTLGTTGTRAMELFVASGVPLTDNVATMTAGTVDYARAQSTATGAAQTASGAMATLADSTASAADKLKALKDQWDSTIGVMLGTSDATIAAEASLDAMTGSIKKNGNAWKISGPGGRANQSQLNDAIRSFEELRLKLIEGGTAPEVANAKMGAYLTTLRDSLPKAATAARAELQLLIDKAKALPTAPKLTVTADTSQASAALSALAAQFAALGSSYAVGGSTYNSQVPVVPGSPRIAPTSTSSGSSVNNSRNSSITVNATAAPGEAAATSVPRALRSAAFLAGMGG